MTTNTMTANFKESCHNIKVASFSNEETVPNEEICIEYYEKSTIQTTDELEHQLMLRTSAVTLPERLLSEKIAPPTIECKKKAQSIISILYNDFRLHPLRISASIDEGIFIKYSNYSNQKDLSIEIYNDLSVGAIVTKSKEIITSMDIHNESFSELYKIYYAS